MLDEWQQKAHDFILENEISIINAKAGSGKSFTLEHVEKTLKEQGWLVSKVAPTGKASKRIGGTTIHRWLDPEVDEDKWGNPKILFFKKEMFSDKEVLLVDEASMIDDVIWNKIMEIWNNTNYGMKKLVFVGDEGQLEPVGYGQPFINLIRSRPEIVNELKKIHRNAEGNDIVVYANAVREGTRVNVEDFVNVHNSNRDLAIKMVFEDKIGNQILSPKKKGINGTENINLTIQSMFGFEEKAITTQLWVDNPNGGKMKVDDKEIFMGDKVVVTKNNLAYEVTNGTVGIVKRIGKELVERYIMGMLIKDWVDVIYIEDDYDGKELFIPIKWATTALDLAYSLTVHKYQGSQNKNIFFMLTPDQTMYWSKKMAYTGVTRAVENLYLVGK